MIFSKHSKTMNKNSTFKHKNIYNMNTIDSRIKKYREEKGY